MPPPPHPAGLRRRTRLLLLVVLASPLAIPLVRLLAVSDGEAGTAAAPADARRAGLPRPVLGFAVNAHHIGDLGLYLRSVDAIHDLGANTLVVVTPMYVRHADSDRVRFVRSRCATDAQLTALLERARSRGMATALMPIVLIEEPEDKDWRGVLRPDDWDAWWASYEEAMERFIRIAVASHVDLFSVGSELNSTETQVDRWGGFIDRVRARYQGTITYSANWDRFDRMELWPLVDVMSVSAYFELERSHPAAPEAALAKAWRPIQTELRAAAHRWAKPLLLIEIGYPSLPWAAAHPWNYVADSDQPADHAAQARAWRAFFTAWRDPIADRDGPFIGFCGYRWDPYHDGGEGDTGYGIEGKPSKGVIESGLRSMAEAQRDKGTETQRAR